MVGSAVYGPRTCSKKLRGARAEESGHRADQQQRGRLAERPGERQDAAREDAGRRVRQDVTANDLPARGTHTVGRFADAVRHRPERLHRDDDDERHHEDRERQAARDRGAPVDASGPGDAAHSSHEDDEAQDAVDDRRDTGEVPDVRDQDDG